MQSSLNSSCKRLMDELMGMRKDNGKDGFILINVSENNLRSWNVSLFGPPNSLHQGGYYPATITFPKNYPIDPPKVKFQIPMHHPNIYLNGEVCISILHTRMNMDISEGKHEIWSHKQTIRSVLISIVSMLASPNIDSPANIEAAFDYRKYTLCDDTTYPDKVRAIVEKSRTLAKRDDVQVPLTTEEYCAGPSKSSISDMDKIEENKQSASRPGDNGHPGASSTANPGTSEANPGTSESNPGVSSGQLEEETSQHDSQSLSRGQVTGPVEVDLQRPLDLSRHAQSHLERATPTPTTSSGRFTRTSVVLPRREDNIDWLGDVHTADAYTSTEPEVDLDFDHCDNSLPSCTRVTGMMDRVLRLGQNEMLTTSARSAPAASFPQSLESYSSSSEDDSSWYENRGLYAILSDDMVSDESEEVAMEATDVPAVRVQPHRIAREPAIHTRLQLAIARDIVSRRRISRRNARH